MRSLRKGADRRGRSLSGAATALQALVFFLFMAVLTFTDLSQSRLDLAAGDIAPENIIAPRRIVDARATRSLREIAAANTPPVYDYINSAYESCRASVTGIFAELALVYPENITEEAAQALNLICPAGLSAEEAVFLSGLGASRRARLEAACLQTVDEMYSSQLKTHEMDENRLKAAGILEGIIGGGREFELANRIVGASLLPNHILNTELTDAAREFARQSVSEVVYETGQTIISRGKPLTSRDVELLRDNGLLRRGLFEDPVADASRLALLGILCALFSVHAGEFDANIRRMGPTRPMMLAQFFAVMAIGKVCVLFSAFLVPAAFLTMSAAQMFSPRHALIANTYFCLMASLTLQLDLDSIMCLFVSGLAGLHFSRSAVSRLRCLTAGAGVSAVNTAMILLTAALRTNTASAGVTRIIQGAAGGLLSSALAVFSMLFWEKAFNVATPYRLSEMCAPSDPLMRMMALQAPGTYHHSMLVASISEAAAREIGADHLLTRAGAYYHDIGKTGRAGYFSENQKSGDPNPLDLISPDVSAGIIRNHVPDGVSLALGHRLPEAVTDFIRTHHGTSQISFFKDQAAAGGYQGEEGDFSYDGSLAVSRECTIVMLADSAEAAVRSMDTHDAGAVDAAVRAIVEAKQRDGQLAASELSLGELGKVTDSFVSGLCSIYHSRVKYPGQAGIKEEGT